MYANTVQSPRGDPVSILDRSNLQSTRHETSQGRLRARSFTREQEGRSKEVQDRMEHTIDFINKGFKPNTRGEFIQETFATLEELLVNLPKSISFDIEISMVLHNPRIMKTRLKLSCIRIPQIARSGRSRCSTCRHRAQHVYRSRA